MSRFALELSEKMGMTEGALRRDMSGLELRRRVVLEQLRQQDNDAAMKKAKRK